VITLKKYIFAVLSIFIMSMAVQGCFAADNSVSGDIIQKEVNNGDEFTIELTSNPTTGYQWEANWDDEYVKLISQKYVPDQHLPGMVGFGGTEIYTFKALKKGHTEIRLDYMRPWDNSLPVKSYLYSIKINNMC
jgi:predicted secreted protein